MSHQGCKQICMRGRSEAAELFDHGCETSSQVCGPHSFREELREEPEGAHPECKDLAEAAWMRREALGFDARARGLPALAFGCSSNNPGGYTGRSGSSSPPDPRLRLEQCKKKM